MATQAEISYRWNVIRLIAGFASMGVGTVVGIVWPDVNASVYYIGKVYLMNWWLWCGLILMAGEGIASIITAWKKRG